MRGVSNIFAGTSLAKAFPTDLEEWLTPRMREEIQEMIQIGEAFCPNKNHSPVISRCLPQVDGQIDMCADWEVLAADAFKANWEQKEERWTVSQQIVLS